MIIKMLSTKCFGRNFIHFERVNSTNTYLKQNSSLPNGTAVMADEQFDGRGRRGNSWIQNKGESLAFSVLIHGAKLCDMGVLPLICGLATADALGQNAALKWPNDVLLNNKKICGILCESLICGESISAVCGFGVNLLQSADCFQNANLPHASSVFAETGEKLSPKDAAEKILNSLEKLWLEYKSNGINGIITRYSDVCVTLNKTVKVTFDGNEVLCRAVGINSDGSLLCENESGRFSVRAGDTSVRGVYGYV